MIRRTTEPEVPEPANPGGRKQPLPGQRPLPGSEDPAGPAEDRFAALQQQHELKLQDRQNNRLQLLTVVSAIFLPLTPITGIYGMNFRHMPELSWRVGYGLMILIMLAVAAVLLYIFYRGEWFR